MKILLATYGSRGDLQPLLALAISLKDRGHDILLCAEPEDADWGARYNIPYIKLGSDLQKFTEETGSPDFDRFEFSAKKFKRANSWGLFFQHEIMTQFAQLSEIVKDVDIVLSSGFVYGARTIAEYFRIPYRFITYCPQLLPSAHYPYPSFPNMNMHQWRNRVSWWFGQGIENFILKKIINKERARLDLNPYQDICTYRLGHQVIVASDRILGSVPSDTGLKNVHCGYFHLKQKGELNASLIDFLDTGPPPVFIGFGSMIVDYEFESFKALIVETARLAHQRIILGNGGSHSQKISEDPDCFVVSNVPHDQLFKRVKAVVHHGGAGTTATAARAGVPQIIVPHFFDQYYWGEQVFRKGLINKAGITLGLSRGTNGGVLPLR